MRRLVAGLAITLDGVTEGAGDWMMLNDEAGEIIAEGIAQADAILFGRRTYLDFAQLWPRLGSDQPMGAFMNNTQKYVLSRTLTSADWAGSELLSGDLATVVGELKARPGRNIQVPGSPALVRDLLLAGLLDELALMIHPIVLGTGARLFSGVPERLDLELVGSRTLRNGVVAVTYRRSAG